MPQTLIFFLQFNTPEVHKIYYFKAANFECLKRRRRASRQLLPGGSLMTERAAAALRARAIPQQAAPSNVPQ